MRLMIDHKAAEQFTYLSESAGVGDRRRVYCAQEPYRAILVCHNGLVLEALIGQVVDALISEERGELPFAREANVGQRHTQISIFGPLPHTPSERNSSRCPGP